ncbi:hypothetical protein JW968_03835 [Candidatus Woesearchaeota archaeon]|nr:hypothetical protein [Candidatus Woesearchaeota archaeon]
MEDSLGEMQTMLSDMGFRSGQTQIITSLCRDDILNPFHQYVESLWKDTDGSFRLGGLVGFPTGGATGMGAAMHHAPNTKGPERYLIFAGAHVSIGQNGVFGDLTRNYRAGNTGACGAALKFLGRLESDPEYKPTPNRADREQYYAETTLLKNAASILGHESRSDRVHALTQHSAKHIDSDLDETLAATGITKNGTPFALILADFLHTPEGLFLQLNKDRSVIQNENGVYSFN